MATHPCVKSGALLGHSLGSKAVCSLYNISVEGCTSIVHVQHFVHTQHIAVCIGMTLQLLVVKVYAQEAQLADPSTVMVYMPTWE